MTPTYNQTLKFTEWLKTVRPKFEIESDKYCGQTRHGDIEVISYDTRQ